jgi:hypothetical protein
VTSDKRDLLTVLKAELQFVEKGGYRNTNLSAWRPQFIFQDSPTCLNFDSAKPSRSCSECALIQLVPANLRGRNLPCRYIPLNEQGESIDSFYRSGTREELESAFRKWIVKAIQQLETPQHAQKSGHAEDPGETEIHVRARATRVD